MIVKVPKNPDLPQVQQECQSQSLFFYQPTEGRFGEGHERSLLGGGRSIAWA